MSSSFVVYLIGYILVIAGVAYGMAMAGVGQPWIVVTLLILAGLGVVFAFSRSQQDEAAKGASSRHNTGGQAGNQSQPPQDGGQQGSAGTSSTQQ